jgi:hypothetical protein
MPLQAFGESEYFVGTLFCKICDKEHATPSLGHSAPLAVQCAPADITRPAVEQLPDAACKCAAIICGEQSGDIFRQGKLKPASSQPANNSSCMEEQS